MIRAPVFLQSNCFLAPERTAAVRCQGPTVTRDVGETRLVETCWEQKPYFDSRLTSTSHEPVMCFCNPFDHDVNELVLSLHLVEGQYICRGLIPKSGYINTLPPSTSPSHISPPKFIVDLPASAQSNPTSSHLSPESARHNSVTRSPLQLRIFFPFKPEW